MYVRSGSLDRHKSPKRDRHHSSGDRRRRSPEQSHDQNRQRSLERYNRGGSENRIGNDLANQLQDIVRGELRKIMEVTKLY